MQARLANWSAGIDPELSQLTVKCLLSTAHLPTHNIDVPNYPNESSRLLHMGNVAVVSLWRVLCLERQCLTLPGLDPYSEVSEYLDDKLMLNVG